MKIEALRDFDIGKPLTAGQQADINDNDARGLISIGFAKAVDEPAANKPAPVVDHDDQQ